MSSTIPRFICLKQVVGLLGGGLSTAARHVQLPGFPEPFYIGGRKVWIEDEVIAWAMTCRRPRKR